MTIALVVGTRPEIIKMAPIIWELQNRDIKFFLVHSNQHYSSEMDEVFFRDLNLPRPKYHLNVGSGSHGNQTGNILIKIEPIFQKEKPKVVLIQGDTNTVLAAGMAASKLGIPVGHVEAGLRSYDRSMPEETNRVIVDHLSSFLFAVTSKQKKILVGEGIEDTKIHVTGNTVIDALYTVKKSGLGTLRKGLVKNNYILLTAHRAKNVDDPKNLSKLVMMVNQLAESLNIKVVFPIHPRTESALRKSGFSFSNKVEVLNPQNYLDFCQLLDNAYLVITDSGGVQEEACALQVPCVTIRENTERPETIEVGANILASMEPEDVITKVKNMLDVSRSWPCPFGQGDASIKIVDILEEAYPDLIRNSLGERVTVIGMGYMGLPMTLLLAKANHEVSGFDINEDKLIQLRSGNLPFDEPGLLDLYQDVWKNKNLTFDSVLKASDAYIISVPTPLKNKKCDLTYVLKAFQSILEVCVDSDLIIVESTIPPGTCREVLWPMAENVNKKILLAHCPERAIPGSTINELKHNTRLVGGLCETATERAAEIYRTFVEGEIVRCDITEAEFAKVAENTYRDINIAFANQLDDITSQLDVSSKNVIRLANLHPRVNILSPGVGVGGHCIAIDPWFLLEGIKGGNLIREARNINDSRPSLVASRVSEYCKSRDLHRIAILGTSYKPNVDDTRESPVLDLVKGLEEYGYEVKCHDPLAVGFPKALYALDEILESCEVAVIAVEHTIFSKYEFNIPVLNCLGFETQGTQNRDIAYKSSTIKNNMTQGIQTSMRI